MNGKILKIYYFLKIKHIAHPMISLKYTSVYGRGLDTHSSVTGGNCGAFCNVYFANKSLNPPPTVGTVGPTHGSSGRSLIFLVKIGNTSHLALCMYNKSLEI
jgi:hypothetical protein